MPPRKPLDEFAVERAAGQLRAALESLGWPREDRELATTHDRVVRAWAEMFRGLREDPPTLATLGASPPPAGLVTLYDLRFYSLCGHHLLPFFGRAHIAYRPSARVAGLGDLARVVEHFASRPTFQERLATDIAGHLERELMPSGVGVVLQGRHFCLEMRGERQKARFECSSFSGTLEDPSVRAEFVSRIGPRSAGS